MKAKTLKLVISFIIVMVASCDEPETTVTDIVHADGSVTRKIEMRNVENKFEISKIQVPFDSTWTVRDSIEISKEGDTTWVKRAEKFFESVEEINDAYHADSGSNRIVTRDARFRKKFRWFDTEYRFSENVQKQLEYGYPVSDFLNAEELTWFYSPEIINDEKKEGPDSIKYKVLNDSVKKKTDLWATKSLVSEWIGTFSKLAEGKSNEDMTFQSLKNRENAFTRIIEDNSGKSFDSLWTNGILLKQFIGESNAERYKTEADSALKIVTDKFFIDFKKYNQKIMMPGKLIGTNGFVDSAGVVLWQVRDDFFISEDLEMWAESKISNTWAWVVSGAFLLFVFAGIIFRIIKKG